MKETDIDNILLLNRVIIQLDTWEIYGMLLYWFKKLYIVQYIIKMSSKSLNPYLTCIN